MPGDPRKRQKKVERRTARRKEKKHTLIRAQSAGLPGQLLAASKCPVLNCWIIAAEGIGSLHFSRAFPNGQVAVGHFLVDRYCLGVKDAWAEVLHRTDYEEKYLRGRPSDVPPRQLTPPDARKLIEGAVAYARENGISPHPDYEKTMLLFGDVDPAESTASFEFGKDGMPLYVAGPRDSLERSREVLSILSNHCGEGNYHYVIPFVDPNFFDDLPDGHLEEEDQEDT